MSITQQHTQEQLSRAYVMAVAGDAGINLLVSREHDYGIDGTFRPVRIIGSRRVESGIALDFQLKCTTRWEEQETCIIYDCEADTYNGLVSQDSTEEATRCMLLVLCLPDTREDWLRVTVDGLAVNGCCYWYRVMGEPTENTASRRIRIPKEQLFTCGCLNDLMRRVQEGQTL